MKHQKNVAGQDSNFEFDEQIDDEDRAIMITDNKNPRSRRNSITRVKIKCN